MDKCETAKCEREIAAITKSVHMAAEAATETRSALDRLLGPKAEVCGSEPKPQCVSEIRELRDSVDYLLEVVRENNRRLQSL